MSRIGDVGNIVIERERGGVVVVPHVPGGNMGARHFTSEGCIFALLNCEVARLDGDIGS